MATPRDGKHPSVTGRRKFSSPQCSINNQKISDGIFTATFVHSMFLLHQKGRVGCSKTRRNFLYPLLGRRQAANSSTVSLKPALLLAAVEPDTVATGVNYGQIFLGGISIAVGSLLAVIVTGFLANSKYEELENEIREEEEY